MKSVKICSEYCIGCGLCQSQLHVNMTEDEKGYIYPVFLEQNGEFLRQVCPVLNTYKDRKHDDLIWGSIVKAVGAYSSDADIRKKSSSGGVLTALAIYLLESGKVDGVIQVCADNAKPTQTVCRVSTTKEDILVCCGSRYAISTPWVDVLTQLEKDKTYAAIGKPCDISALRRLREVDADFACIKYLLSFFCAGLPSKNANTRLLKEMGCKEEECVSLCYRGNGWPGMATAVDKKGNSYTMEYSKAWGQILGRDVHPFCRLCLDGIGEAADVACGDGWYIKNNQPDFAEREGRNIVFARNEIGSRLLDEAADAGYIQMSHWEDLEDLKVIQKYQYTRKTTMKAKLWGYRLCGRVVPVYDKRLLNIYAERASLKEKIKMFLGTMKRIVQGKI